MILYNQLRRLRYRIIRFIDAVMLPDKESLEKKLKANEGVYKQHLINYLQEKIPGLEVNALLQQKIVIVPLTESAAVFEKFGEGDISILKHYDAVWKKDTAQLWLQFISLESVHQEIYNVLVDYSKPGFIVLKAYFKQ